MCRDGLQIAEIRLDLAQSQTEESARTLLSAVSALPSILTIRPPFEGGKFAADENKRRNLFYRLLPFASAADIELSAPILSPPQKNPVPQQSYRNTILTA